MFDSTHTHAELTGMSLSPSGENKERNSNVALIRTVFGDILDELEIRLAPETAVYGANTERALVVCLDDAEVVKNMGQVFRYACSIVDLATDHLDQSNAVVFLLTKLTDALRLKELLVELNRIGGCLVNPVALGLDELEWCCVWLEC